MADFGRDRDCWNVASITANRDQRRLSRNVVVPNVVMHRLKVPHHFAGGTSKGDDRTGVVVASVTFAAVIVRAGVAGRKKEKVSGGIGRYDRPDVRGTEPINRFSISFRTLVVIWRKSFPGPFEFARSSVKSPNDSAGRIDSIVVTNRRADDDQVVDDCGRRSDSVFAGPRDADPRAQIDLPFFSEVGARLASRSIESNESRVDGADEDSSSAGLTGFQLRVDPRRDARAS